MGDLGDDVVEALDVLNVDCRVDIDAAVEQLLDIEVALGMTAARRIGMGKFVHQRDLRMAGDDGVEIHLLERLPLVFETPARDDLEAVEQGLRLLAAMRFDDADHDVVAVLLPGARLLQHLVGLADAGSRADENLEPAGFALFRRAASSKASGEGRWSEVAPLIHHQESDLPPCGHEPEKSRAYRTRSCCSGRNRGSK